MRILFFLLCCGFLFGQEPIDVVFTWVDDSDPKWAEKKEEYLRRECPESTEGTQPFRFRNRGELKYALRSVNDFAPFINHIFIVTDEQRPAWLKEHPKVTIVPHKDIFLEKKDLPTFNSSAIEANLHRIEGLAEKYIFCNDDFFFGKKVCEDDFFTEDGQIRFFETKAEIPRDLVGWQKRQSIMKRAWNTTQELRRVYGDDKEHFFLHHVPYVMRKSLVQDVEQQFPEVFKKVSAAKFRSEDTGRVTCCLVPYAGFYTGRAKPSQCDCHYFSFRSSVFQDVRHMNKLFKERPKFFCVQDEAIRIDEEAEEKLLNFFETYFPNPAPWEVQ